jgi:hypothetical protein
VTVLQASIVEFNEISKYIIHCIEVYICERMNNLSEIVFLNIILLCGKTTKEVLIKIA